MKLKFKVQPYQTMAVDAVVDCFAGQPFSVGPAYRIDPGKRNQAEAFDDEGFRNPDMAQSARSCDFGQVEERTLNA